MIWCKHLSGLKYSILFGYLALLHHLCHATEVTQSSQVLDTTLEDLVVPLPVLVCHARVPQGSYSSVLWYKDDQLLRRGGSAPEDHVMSLATLLPGKVQKGLYRHPLQLQGYYWCETDHLNASQAYKFLFRVKEVHTYAAKLVAHEDSLGDSNELTLDEKLDFKRKIYEKELQNQLFEFLLKPNAYVTSVKVREDGGLEVRFYLFARPKFHPRAPLRNDLVEERHELENVLDFLYNRTDQKTYRLIEEFTRFKGIDVEDIVLRGTLGCYSETTSISAELTWPDAYIGNIVIPNEGCSDKSGSAVTRMCRGSFYDGARWGIPSGQCDKPDPPLTTDLRRLYQSFGDVRRPQYIRDLVTLTADPSRLTVTDLHIATNTLLDLSKVAGLQVEDLNNVFSIIDKMLDTNRTELQAAKDTIYFPIRLLEVIDNFLTQATLRNREFLELKKNLIIETKVTRDREFQIVGVTILSEANTNSLENGAVQFLGNGSTVPKSDSLAYFTLPNELVHRESLSQSKSQLSMVFFRDWSLFPDPKDIPAKKNYEVLSTPVIYVTLSGGPVWDLEDPVELYFKDLYQSSVLEEKVCVYFDPRLDGDEGGWSREGCEFGGLQDGFYLCRCHHLSTFSLFLSENPATKKSPRKVAVYRMGTSVYVGCALSIIALSFVVLLYLLSKHWRKTVDQSLLFWQALSLLYCLILLFISEMRFLWRPGCLLLGFLLHYGVLVVFGWLLVQSLMHKLRFGQKSDIEEIPSFVLKAGMCVWCIPILIMIIIWVSKDFYFYDQKTCWKTVRDVSRACFIPTVVVMVLSACLDVSALYAVSCRFKRDFLIGDNVYGKSVNKFRVALSVLMLFFLSWLFGFWALQNGSTTFRVLFSIFITFTSFYLMLFFVFHDMSLRDLCDKWKTEKKPQVNVAVQYTTETKAEVNEEKTNAKNKTDVEK